MYKLLAYLYDTLQFDIFKHYFSETAGPSEPPLKKKKTAEIGMYIYMY